MRKYNKPEIVTLALDAVDVIETSTLVTTNVEQALANVGNQGGYASSSVSIQTSIDTMRDNWSW